ncbi:MAG: pyridoxamine 5'-phosphate oxidase family protein [Mucilaginibacter polytrichastri]|nr:pyridoxamine 5'-phosphate oxidase family protein [Mucilaginibacter polytrichastri]
MSNKYDLLKTVWDKLESAQGSDAYHTAALGTRTFSGVELRTVILRAADRNLRELWFYTDVRSPKVDQIIQQPGVSWLFYDAESKIQLRLCGEATIHHLDAQTRKIWDELPFHSRLDYLAEPGPGSKADSPLSGVEHIDREKKDLAETGHGYANFCRVKTVVASIDQLVLNTGGHERICFEWDGNKWQADWLIP